MPPQPMPGMAIAAEYGNRFDADLAVAMLEGYGIEASVWSDPVLDIARHYSSDTVYAVVVRDEILEDAQEVLGHASDPEAEALDALYHVTRFRDRPLWVRRTAVVLLVAVAGPFAWAALQLAVRLVDAIGP